MLDTVAVGCSISPTPNKLKSWVSHPLIYPGKEPWRKYFQRTRLDNGASIDFVFYPSNPRYPEPYLQAEFSIPKVLFGENVSMLQNETEILESIMVVNKHISTLSWMPSFNVGEGQINRVDLVYNYNVENRIQDYIKSLYNSNYPNRDTRPYPPEGVQFYSMVASSKFYDKQKESRLMIAVGLLRHELTLRKAYHINRRMKTSHATLTQITRERLTTIRNTHR